MAYYFNLPAITELTTAQQAALNDPNPIIVFGGPGTGKSVVALYRHIRNYDLGAKQSVLLTFTKTLQAYLTSSARTRNENAANAISRTKYWVTNKKCPYDEIIVDEAQDVDLVWYETIRHFTNSLCYGADEDQSIYLTSTALSELLSGLKSWFPNNKEHIFDENFRNTLEITQFIKALFPHRRIDRSTITGIKPKVLISNNSNDKKNKAIFDIIEEFSSESHNIAIFVPTTDQVISYHNLIKMQGIVCSKYIYKDTTFEGIEKVHVGTFKSSKGTEFDTVIIPDFEQMKINNKTLKVGSESAYYVALTRARKNIYLICNSLPSFLQTTPAQIDTYEKIIL
jgi:superfamily I DNA/RNA helicase